MLRPINQFFHHKVNTPVLTHTGNFPGIWKRSKVTVLFKSGGRTIATNYRPISILPTLSKQFGFRSKRSKATALSGFADEVLLNMEKGNI